MGERLIDEWNRLILSISDEEKEWLISYQLHESAVATRLFELEDYVSFNLKGIPDEGCVVVLSQLLKEMRKEISLDDEKKL